MPNDASNPHQLSPSPNGDNDNEANVIGDSEELNGASANGLDWYEEVTEEERRRHSAPGNIARRSSTRSNPDTPTPPATAPPPASASAPAPASAAPPAAAPSGTVAPTSIWVSGNKSRNKGGRPNSGSAGGSHQARSSAPNNSSARHPPSRSGASSNGRHRPAFLQAEVEHEANLRKAALESKKSSKRSSPGSSSGPPSKKSYAAAAGSAHAGAPSKGEKSKHEGTPNTQAPGEAAPAANPAAQQVRKPATSAPPPAPPVAGAVTAGDGGQSRANQLIAAANAAEFRDLGGMGLNTSHPPPVTLNSLIHVIGDGVGREIQDRVGDQLQGFQAETLQTLRDVLQAAFTRLGDRLGSLPQAVTEERLVQVVAGHLELTDRRLDGILATMSRERLVVYLLPLVWTLLAHIFR